MMTGGDPGSPDDCRDAATVSEGDRSIVGFSTSRD